MTTKLTVNEQKHVQFVAKYENIVKLLIDMILILLIDGGFGATIVDIFRAYSKKSLYFFNGS